VYRKKEGYFQKPEHATPPTAFLDAVVHAGEEFAVETASVLERRCCHHHRYDRFKASGLVFSDD
jgi:hypothetical protein